jgi:hypothetical protein
VRPGRQRNDESPMTKATAVSAMGKPNVCVCSTAATWEIGWQVPPWATRAEPPRDALQHQTMVTESVAPLALIRNHTSHSGDTP